MHVDADDAAVTPEYFPAPHARHELTETAPIVDEYFPATHDRQPDVTSVEGLYLPASQLVHAPSPNSDLYLPAEQPLHAAPTRVKPGLHWHEACASKLSELAGHARQLSVPNVSL
jgi:hypothetical protein